ncbi:DDE-type integrase/transposase/recombinase [Nitrospirillum viridazoti]|uniref:DDE-type integrase/transposase/recombinase n=1 Tax=Nitrospirillum viridazoti TaxID=3144925 RepID=UPI000593C7B5
MALTGLDHLWVGDITYVAVAAGFVYLAVILDAWSCRVVGYAISRSIDTGIQSRPCIQGTTRSITGQFRSLKLLSPRGAPQLLGKITSPFTHAQGQTRFGWAGWHGRGGELENL